MTKIYYQFWGTILKPLGKGYVPKHRAKRTAARASRLLHVVVILDPPPSDKNPFHYPTTKAT